MPPGIAPGEPELSKGDFVKTGYPVPSIDELRQRYIITVPIALETIVRSRWMSNEHTPNGTDELLAWLLILIDMNQKQGKLISDLQQIVNLKDSHPDWLEGDKSPV